MKPPEDVSAQDLWTKLQETPAPSEVVDFPRRDPRTGKFIGQVRIIVQDVDSHERCRVRAMERLRKMPRVEKGDSETALGRELLGDMVARELLLDAIHRVDPIDPDAEKLSYPKAFLTNDQLGKLTADELTALFTAYLMVQEKYGPTDRNLTKEEVDAWILRLVEGGSALPLARLGSQALAELTLLLAVRVFFMSAALASRSSNSENTLAVALEEWGCATFSSGEQLEGSTRTGTREPINIEEAIAAGRKLIEVMTMTEAPPE